MNDSPHWFSNAMHKLLLLGAAVLSAALFSTGCAVSKMGTAPPPSPSSGQLSLNPTALNFGNVSVGASKNMSGTLTAGSSPITVSSATWNGPGYSLSGINFPATVPAGQAVPFTVTFAPQAAGTTAGSVSFLSNATNSPAVEQWTGDGTQGSQHSVALTWNPDASTVQGYYVYRGLQSGGPYGRVSPLQSATAYRDAAVASGQTYYYVVTALGTNAVESGFSNESTASIP